MISTTGGLLTRQNDFSEMKISFEQLFGTFLSRGIVLSSALCGWMGDNGSPGRIEKHTRTVHVTSVPAQLFFEFYCGKFDLRRSVMAWLNQSV